MSDSSFSSNLLLEMRDLKLHSFTGEGVVKAVDGVSYEIAQGKTLCVIGESGSGKSVAARAILRIVHRPGKIVGGNILYHRPLASGGTEAIDITALNPRGANIRSIRGEQIAMIFQEPMLCGAPASVFESCTGLNSESLSSS
jgi:ABC-type dipeptide/oligopeptide/nickel transport system ATPase component